jgi:ACS family hexuronate transporter-like MFS transporter
MKVPHLRWIIVGLVFLASVLNYLDRQTLSILAPTIQKNLGMSDIAYANIVNAFLVAYTISYLVSGKLTDVLGTRTAAAMFVGFWSFSNMLTAFARSAGTLGVFRFMLGLGEAGNYTAAPKVVKEWFPKSERGLAIGIYTLGATIGATIAPPLITFIASGGHWERAFLMTGAMGIVWLIPWLVIYRKPEEHPALSSVERTWIFSDRDADEGQSTPQTDWGTGRAIFSQPALWALLLARLLTDPLWYFYQSWFAKYLAAERGLTQEQLSISWVVFLAADIGSVAGGYLSGVLIKRGGAAPSSRLKIMLLCACLTPLSPLVALLSNLNPALGMAMIVVLAHMAWLINLSALVVDLVPQKNLGTVFGLVAAGSTAGGIVMNNLVAYSVGAHGYRPAFIAMAGLHLVAWSLLFVLLRPYTRAEKFTSFAVQAATT